MYKVVSLGLAKLLALGSGVLVGGGKPVSVMLAEHDGKMPDEFPRERNTMLDGVSH